MPTSLGKVTPFIVVNKSADLYGTSGYPVGGTNPPVSGSVSAPLPPGESNPGPLPGTNCINLLTLRDYYKIPYPPTTPLASPPVIGIISFGGGIYGQPVSSGKYSGFWRCTDISGANGAPIQILVSPMNGAINAPNADDGGATLENTVDVATISAFYGMINQGRDAPVYTPPVIILYIAPSDDISEIYRSFYTVLNNPVVCNGQSYLPSVVCCSWGAPEVSWTQKMPFPNPGTDDVLDESPNPAGIAEMNEINDLLADATKRGINICVASGDIPLPENGPPSEQSQSMIGSSKIMFPASSPYVTCVGGSSVFFPNGPVRNYTNPGEFAWVRGQGGISNAFPIPDYQVDIAGSALISANAFLESSQNTSNLLETALGAANVNGASGTFDSSGNLVDSSNNEVYTGFTQNVSLIASVKKAAYDSAQAAYNSASAALQAANSAASGDAASLQLLLAFNAANTALVAAKAGNDAAQAALLAAQDAVVKTTQLDVLLKQCATAYNLADVQYAGDGQSSISDKEDQTMLYIAARDAALLVANKAVAQGASSVFAPVIKNDLSTKVNDVVKDATSVSNDLVVPYDSFPVSKVTPPNLVALYSGDSTYTAKANLTKIQTDLNTLKEAIDMDGEGNVYESCQDAQVTALTGGANAQVVALATEAARLVTTLDQNVSTVAAAQAAWTLASDNMNDASGALNVAITKRQPDSTAAEIATARDALSAALQVLSDASVALANAEYAALVKANATKAAMFSLVGDSSGACNISAYVNLFDASDNAYYLGARGDASGALVLVKAVQESMGYLVAGSLEKLGTAAKIMADEMALRNQAWLDVSGNASTAIRVSASEKAIAAATRAADVTNSLKKLFNNVELNKALDTVWLTTGADASGYARITKAATDVNAALANMYSSLLGEVDASDATAMTSIDTATASLSTFVTDSSGIFAAGTNRVTELKLSERLANALPAVLFAEGELIYVTNHKQIYTSTIGTNEADNAAAVSAVDAIYDEFIALNIAVDNAIKLADLALKRANLVNGRIQDLNGWATTTSLTPVVNASLMDAQNAAYKLIAASSAINHLMASYSTITPSLLDASLRSQTAIMDAAEAANAATMAKNPPPVTPQMVEALQRLVLKAKAEAKLLCESQPTVANFTAILTNWNTAVLKGAATLDALDETLVGSNLVTILDAYVDAIETAANDGDYYSEVGVPDTSDLSLAAKAAYKVAHGSFGSAVNGANLKYLMTVASDAISAAVTASEQHNANQTNPLRANATSLWHSAASKIEAFVGVSTAFDPTKLVLPYDLLNTVNTAYKQTTNLSVSGTVKGTVTSTELTVLKVGVSIDTSGTLIGDGSVAIDTSGTLVKDISGNFATGSLLSYRNSSNVNVTAVPVNAQTTTTIKNATGVYSITGGQASNSDIFITVTLPNVDPSAQISSSDAYSTAAYSTAVAAYNAFRLAYDSYNKNFVQSLQDASTLAYNTKASANTAITLALAAAARTQAAAQLSAEMTSLMATRSLSYQDDAALNSTKAAYAAADNVNMYRCIPDIAMHANADDLPIIYRLNGGNVYVGGTSVAAAMFAGFLGVTQSHSPINYFINPVLYNNFTFPSPLLYDISGTNELIYSSIVTGRYDWVVNDELSEIHGSYNSHVGLGSIRGDGLSSFLEAPQFVEYMISADYPLSVEYLNVFTAPTQVQITNTVTVRPGTTADVYVYVYKASAYNTNVEWSCSSPYNATVSQTLETIQQVYDTEGDLIDNVVAYRARVTGVVPVDSLATLPVITVRSTDGSNVFTTVNVSVRPAVQVVGVSISALNETKNPANTVLYLGKTLQLIATVTPVAATNKAVYWWSSNTSIVNVDTNGLLTPLSPGQVTIRATTVNNNISASISVYVPTPMTGISVTPSMVTLNPNMLVYPLKNTQLIKALVTPNNVDYKYLQWKVISSQPLALPPGTTDSNGVAMTYKDNHADAADVTVATIHQPNGTVLKRDSNSNIIDNTQDTVTAMSNGRVVVRVSTDGVPDAVYGTYSADVIVNVVTPITNVKLEQMNMVIALNPSVAASGVPLGVYADASSAVNPLVSKFNAVNPPVNVQYSPFDPNLTKPVLNAIVPDRDLPQSYDVKATLFPAYPSNMNLVWSSSNPKVAIVSNNTAPVLNLVGGDPNNGLFQVTEQITPLSNGSTVISVTTADGNKVASVSVTVTTPVTNIVLSPMPVTLNPGKQYALQATVLPTTATITDLMWASTNEAVAKVDQYGVVTAVSSGSCGISVTTADGDYTAMATINVVTPLVGVSLVLNTPTPIRVGDVVQILVVMTPTTASDQAFTWSVTNGVNGNIFTNGPAQNGNIVYLDAAQSGSSVFTVTTHDGNKQANLSLTVAPY